MAITYTIPIFFGRAYPEGPRASTPQPIIMQPSNVTNPPNATIGGAATVSYDFTNSGMSGLQSVLIDNTGNYNPLTLVVADTGQTILVPPLTRKVTALYTGQLAFQAYASTPLILPTAAPPMVLTAIFFNFPQDESEENLVLPIVDNVLASGTITFASLADSFVFPCQYQNDIYLSRLDITLIDYVAAAAAPTVIKGQFQTDGIKIASAVNTFGFEFRFNSVVGANFINKTLTWDFNSKPLLIPAAALGIGQLLLTTMTNVTPALFTMNAGISGVS